MKLAQIMYISLKCLTGDKGDNVPGIPGIGPKTSSTANYNNMVVHSGYLTPLQLIVSISLFKALNENADQILVNYELMDLIPYCDEAIGPANILDIECKINEYRN